MWKNVVAIVIISLALGLIWPNYFKGKTSEKQAAQDHEKKLSTEINRLQDKISATTKEFATCKRLLEDSNAHGQKHKDKINELQDQIKATTEEFTTSQKLLKDCNAHVQNLENLKYEISKLRDQLKATTKEFATCQNQLEECSACSYMSQEKSNDRLYGIIWLGMFIFFSLCCCGIIFGNSNKSHGRSSKYAIAS